MTFASTSDANLTLFQEQINDFITQGAGQELLDLDLEDLRTAINRYLDKGPDFVKYGGTAHFEYPTLIAFSPDQQKVLVEEAHKRGKVAETHATSSESLRIAVRAGLDLIQHAEILSEEYPEDLIRMIKEQNIICSLLSNTITGQAWKTHLKTVEALDKKKTESEENRPLPEGRKQREKTTAELRKEQNAREHGMELRRSNAQKLIRSGCTIVPSTDNYLGSAPEFRREPKLENQEAGIGTIIAIEGLVELGMTPSEAITAATKYGAVACRGLDQFGTVAEGKLADLLIFDADPLADISHIRQPAVVIRDGRIIDLDRLPEKPVWYGR